jgi:hypothetical protein
MYSLDCFFFRSYGCKHEHERSSQYAGSPSSLKLRIIKQRTNHGTIYLFIHIFTIELDFKMGIG